MSILSAPIIKSTSNVIQLYQKTSLRTSAALLFGSLFLALSSHIQVPMIPVPMTMQTFAVTLLGALYGWRLGSMAIILWLGQGALGLPVLAGGVTDLHYFVGPTAGYLFSLPIAGALMGWLAQKGWNGNRVYLAFCGMVLSSTCCLFFGWAWLATIIGYQQALVLGVIPFIAGEIIKCSLGAVTLKLLTRTKAK